MEKISHKEVKRKITEIERNLEKTVSKCRKYILYLLGILLTWCGSLVFLPFLVIYIAFSVYAILCLIFIVKIFPKKVENAGRGLNDLKDLDNSYEISKVKKPIREAITKSIELSVNEVEIPCPQCNSITQKDYKSHIFIDHDYDLVEVSLICDDCGAEFKTMIMNPFSQF